jgi:hypothetical protein
MKEHSVGLHGARNSTSSVSVAFPRRAGARQVDPAKIEHRLIITVGKIADKRAAQQLAAPQPLSASFRGRFGGTRDLPEVDPSLRSGQVWDQSGDEQISACSIVLVFRVHFDIGSLVPLILPFHKAVANNDQLEGC